MSDSAAAPASPPDAPRETPLGGLHRRLGARMAPFAGYAMPIQYPAGILAEHAHVRAQAGLFDVSHMGQIDIRGPGAAAALERLVPGDLQALAPDRIRYTLLTTADGGIADDLMVARRGDDALQLVVNAANKHADLARLRDGLPGLAVVLRDDRALLALQGPAAAAVLARQAPALADLAFMSAAEADLYGVACGVARSGYTGEDGFEISCPAERAAALAEALLAEPEVAPIGLGARDSLRLEAGLCLHGHDIDIATSPIEAGLAWTISKRRRAEGGFPGAERILRELAQGPARRRVGLRLADKAPAREGAEIRRDDRPIGIVTSGGFGPTVGGPIAMGYVSAADAAPGTDVALIVRGKPLAAEIVALPFVPHRYHR